MDNVFSIGAEIRYTSTKDPGITSPLLSNSKDTGIKNEFSLEVFPKESKRPFKSSKE